MNHRILNGVELITKQENRRRLYFGIKLLLFLVMLLLRIWLSDTYEVIKSHQSWLDALFLYLSAHLIVTFGRLLLVRFYIGKNRIKDTIRNNFILGVNRITSIINFGILIVALFKAFEVDLREFFTSISIVAAAIALISKDYISNMINGMILMFSDQLSLGDQIKIGEHKGRIMDITLLNVMIMTDEDDLIYIPNNVVLNTSVINHSKNSEKKLVFEFSLSLAKQRKVQEIEDTLRESLNEFLEFIKPDTIRLKVTHIEKDAIQLNFQLTVFSENRMKEKEIKRRINEAIIERLND
ncbi:mechanosensitive ion channel [Cytophagales bacterium LB-30]|uniref:Mechanosensitive ion channel n=1 Tax=Shiella aurantiaca TaxID=3058365 RepID=A0ABT8F812_9BACT|nr:mechanosensitive ion channel domain-containing protein [Shiella aurantiaca]MDN4166361.1 mechanosensitive ion channel [Shiella aurantiaca]